MINWTRTFLYWSKLPDHPVYHHLPFPQRSVCLSVSPYVPQLSVCPQFTLHTLWLRFFDSSPPGLHSGIYTSGRDLWCSSWIYSAGMCLDFLVWSSTSCSRSHVFNLAASEVRLSSFFCPFHVWKAECVSLKKAAVSCATEVSDLLLVVELAQWESKETGRD